MLSYLVVYWNVSYLILCSALNFGALIVHLGTWRSRYRGYTPAKGSDVSAPAAVTVFFLTSVNLLYLAMCKLPLLHSQWFLNFQFSEIICYIIVVISASYECVQTVCLSILCVFLWHRQKTRNYHHVQSLRLLEDEQDSGAAYQLSNGLRQGCLVVFLASLYSTVVGICASHRFLSFSAISPLSDISTIPGNEEAQVCRAQVPHYHNPTSSHLWEMCFRWMMGFFCPLLFMTFPSVFHLNYKLLRQEKRTISHCGKRRKTSLLQHYLRFCLSILWIDLLLRIPSFIHDVSLWTRGDANLSSVPTVSYKFVLYVLTVIFPELKLLYFPLATLIMLPTGERQIRSTNPKVRSKLEDGSAIELDSFVVSTSTVAIENIPSLVRLPDEKSFLSCFCCKRKEKKYKDEATKFNSSATSVLQKDSSKTTLKLSSQEQQWEQSLLFTNRSTNRKTQDDIRQRQNSGSVYDNLSDENISDFAQRLATSPSTAV